MVPNLGTRVDTVIEVGVRKLQLQAARGAGECEIVLSIYAVTFLTTFVRHDATRISTRASLPRAHTQSLEASGNLVSSAGLFPRREQLCSMRLRWDTTI